MKHARIRQLCWIWMVGYWDERKKMVKVGVEMTSLAVKYGIHKHGLRGFLWGLTPLNAGGTGICFTVKGIDYSLLYLLWYQLNTWDLQQGSLNGLGNI